MRDVSSSLPQLLRHHVAGGLFLRTPRLYAVSQVRQASSKGQDTPVGVWAARLAGSSPRPDADFVARRRIMFPIDCYTSRVYRSPPAFRTDHPVYAKVARELIRNGEHTA